MKKTHVILATAACLLCATPSRAADIDSLEFLTLKGKVANLEAMEANLQRSLDLKKEELAQQVSFSNWFVGSGILVAIVGIFGGVGAIWQARKTAIAKAQEYVVEEVTRLLPSATQAKIKELVALNSEFELQAIFEWSRAQLRVHRLKQQVRILALCEDEESKGKAMAELNAMGFPNVKASMAGEPIDLKAHDLILFYRSEQDRIERQWTKLSNEYVKNLINHHRETPGLMFFYYGPHNDLLNLKMHPRIGMANMPNTIEMHLSKLISTHLNPNNP